MKNKKCEKKLTRTLVLLLILTTPIVFVSAPAKRVQASGDGGQEEQTYTFTAVDVSYQIGSRLSGGYADTYSDDDIYHKSHGRMFRSYDEFEGWVIFYVLEVDYTFKINSWPPPYLVSLALEVNGKARTDRVSNELVNLKIYNYEAGFWEIIGEFAGSTSEQFINFTNAINPRDYVDGAGYMKLKWNFAAQKFDELWVDFQCIKLTIPHYKWTFMVYLDSDWFSIEDEYKDSLLGIEYIPGEKFGYEEMNEMELVGSTSDVAILVQIDRWGKTLPERSALRYFIHKDENVLEITSPILMDLGEVNMGNPSTLSDFVIWSSTWFPSNYSAVVLHDHGDGFMSICVDFNGTKGAVYDYLTMDELKNALNEATTTTGKTIDLVVFVACLMQMAEVAYQIRDYGKLLVASEEAMYAYVITNETKTNIGLPFDSILANLTTTPTMEETELAQVIVNSLEHIFEIHNPHYVVPTISVVNLTHMGNFTDSFTAKLDDFASYLQTKLNSTLDPDIPGCRNRSQEFHNWYYIDLYNFTENIINNTTDTELIEKGVALLDSINQTVIYEWHWPEATPERECSDAHGISIFFPDYYESSKLIYEQLDMSQHHAWDDFLRAYFS